VPTSFTITQNPISRQGKGEITRKESSVGIEDSRQGVKEYLTLWAQEEEGLGERGRGQEGVCTTDSCGHETFIWPHLYETNPDFFTTY
jgi:hypothetical protein